jgi:hypothetical protein
VPANAAIWDLDDETLPPLRSGRPRDLYIEASCHPDIVARVWDQMGTALPPAARTLLRGRPVLACPATQTVVAFALGTAYALLVPADARPAAEAAGLSPIMRWSVGRETDLAATLGPGWYFGKWRSEELDWCAASFAEASN